MLVRYDFIFSSRTFTLNRKETFPDKKKLLEARGYENRDHPHLFLKHFIFQTQTENSFFVRNPHGERNFVIIFAPISKQAVFCKENPFISFFTFYSSRNSFVKHFYFEQNENIGWYNLREDRIWYERPKSFHKDHFINLQHSFYFEIEQRKHPTLFDFWQFWNLSFDIWTHFITTNFSTCWFYREKPEITFLWKKIAFWTNLKNETIFLAIVKCSSDKSFSFVHLNWTWTPFDTYRF